MPLKVYIKAPPKGVKIRNRGKERVFYGSITFLGIAAIIFAAWPFVVWELKVLPKLSSESSEKAPIPQTQVLSAQTTLSDIGVVQDPEGFSYFTTSYKPQGPRPEEFSLSIPKIKVEDARVLVDKIKFDTSLALFPGTALPGEVGNAFITGHSVLPQFADPKNYHTIFTNLPSLEIGDDIEVKLGGKVYHYTVQYSKVVDPRDTSVLGLISQNGKNLTLMTCVPPGTSIKRLIVVASLL